MIKSNNKLIREIQHKAIDKDSDGVFTSARGNVPLIKRYIPYFIYKPPFGFPRTDIDIVNVRKIAQSPVFFSVENTLLNELCALEWDIVPCEGIEEEKVKSKIKSTKDFFKNPNDNDESFRQILRAIGRDIIELDAGTINKVYTAGGKFSQIFTIDGATILKNPDEHGYMGNRADYVSLNLDHNSNQEDIKWYYENYYNKEAAYFQYNWTGGIWPIPFGRKEIIYFDNNSRSDSIYGRSPAQIVYDILLILLYAQNVNLDAYIKNNLPTGIVQIINGNKEQINSTRDYFNHLINEKDNFGNNRHLSFNFPITNTEVKYTPFTFSAKDMQMIEQQKWFQQLVWAVLGVTPDEMGQTDNSNRSTANEQSRIFKRKALKPLLNMIEYKLNTRLVWEDLDPEMEVEFKFNNYDIEEDYRKHELIEKKLVYKTINEIRTEEGLKELDGEKYDGIGATNDGFGYSDNSFSSYNEDNTDFENKDQNTYYDENNNEENENLSNDVDKKALDLKHKYIRREGSPGNYEYWYKDPETGEEYSTDKEESKSNKSENNYPASDEILKNEEKLKNGFDIYNELEEVVDLKNRLLVLSKKKGYVNLYHGSKGDIKDYKYGGDRKLKDRETYGNGLYLAIDPDYSITKNATHLYKIPITKNEIKNLFPTDSFEKPQVYAAQQIKKDLIENKEWLINRAKSLGYTEKQISDARDWIKKKGEIIDEIDVNDWKSINRNIDWDEYDFPSVIFEIGLLLRGYSGVIDMQKNITIIKPNKDNLENCIKLKSNIMEKKTVEADVPKKTQLEKELTEFYNQLEKNLLNNIKG
jgi:phage portal protein BeeE